MSDSQSIQPKLSFGGSSEDIVVSLHLVGLTVQLDVWGNQFNVAWGILRKLGLSIRVDKDRTLKFPVRNLDKLKDAPPELRLLGQGDLKPLIYLLQNPPKEGSVAGVVLGPEGLLLTWKTAVKDETFSLTKEGVAAILSSSIAVLLSPEAWGVLGGENSMRNTTCGIIEENEDGFFEISTTKPQLVESLPIPGMFKLREGLYGVSKRYYNVLQNVNGLQWKNKRIEHDTFRGSLPELSFDVHPHTSTEALALADDTSKYKGTLLSWPTESGRRLVGLLVAEILEGGPLLIICPPHSIWTWQRHLDMLGKSYSLVNNKADVRIVTYDMIRNKSISLISPGTIIFDSIVNAISKDKELRQQVKKLNILRDTYRIGLSSTECENPQELCNVLSVIRPVEFASEEEVSWRQYYGNLSDQRVQEHTNAYVFTKGVVEPEDLTYRRSQVRAVNLVKEQHDALEGLLYEGGNPLEVLAGALEIITVGTGKDVSPKLTTAVNLARQKAGEGQRVAIITSQKRAIMMLRALLSPLRVQVISSHNDEVQEETQAVIVHSYNNLIDLRSFDTVLVIDYPFNTDVLERFIGGAWDTIGSKVVTLIHGKCDIENRLSILSARKRELGAVADVNGGITVAEAAWITGLKNKSE